jgi:hypothetical protein
VSFDEDGYIGECSEPMSFNLCTGVDLADGFLC